MRAPRPAHVVLTGLCGLAAGMGIGRFALTPILPLLVAQGAASLGQGSALAAANYAGYLVGAVACMWVHADAGRLARAGLVAVAASTLAMGLTDSFAAWLAWRFVAGIASALVLVGFSSWALRQLADAGRAHWAGAVFAGVGLGIAFAGLVVLALDLSQQAAAISWLALGAAAAAVAAALWRSLASTDTREGPPPAASARFDGKAWLLIACYGTFGFGYIVPATYLPALARQAMDGTIASALVWPVFGIAGALSTAVAAFALRNVAPRVVWLACHVVMAAGVAAPALVPGGAALVFAALAIGGTFMLLTMAAMQDARRVAGPSATRLIAAMTASFALGQLAGPVAVALLASRADALEVASFAAAALLVAGAAGLAATLVPSRATPSRTSKEIRS